MAKENYKPLEAWRIISKATEGITPAIVLINPKYAHNVGMATRLASCYGIKQVWFTETRVHDDIIKHNRIPREERLKGYQDVDLIWSARPFDFFEKIGTPVAIEVRKDSEPLHQFEHPKNPVYVFGAEDDSITKGALHRCHRFVVIPTRHCLNLATAISTILWDKQYKHYLNNDDKDFVTPGIFERRGMK